MSTNNVIVSETNYNVTVDESNNLTVEIALPSVGPSGPVGYTGSAGADGVIGRDGYVGSVGYTGSKGADGYVGADGAQGYTGSKGADGIIGYNGSIGYTGSAGIQGYTGSKGEDGIIGYNGSIGYTGSASTIPGPQGPIGYTGSSGTGGGGGSSVTVSETPPATPLNGDMWWNSADGQLKVRYEDTDSAQWVDAINGIVGPTGYVGSQGIQGYTGSQGDIGYTGSQGDIGYVGSQGVQGYTGSQGIQGVQGLQGYTGSQGDIGYTGSASTVIGYTGSKGQDGAVVLDDLNDVTIATPTAAQILGYNGSQWINTAAPQGAPGYLYSGTVTTQPTGTGEDTLVIGDGSVGSYYTSSVVIGKTNKFQVYQDAGTATTLQSNVLIGSGNTVTSSTSGTMYNNTFIGNNHTISMINTGHSQNVLIGNTFGVNSGQYSDIRYNVKIGEGGNYGGEGNILLGNSVSIPQGTSWGVCIGKGTAVATSFGIAIGYQAATTGMASASAIAIGGSSSAAGGYAIALGESSSAGGHGAIAIGGGQYTGAAGMYAIAIGYAAKAQQAGCISIGSASNNGFAYTYNVGFGRIDIAAGSTFAGESSQLTSGAFSTKIRSPSRLDFNMWYKTTTATQAELGTGSISDTPTGYIAQPTNSVMVYEIQLVAYRTDVAGEYASWKIESMSHKQTTAVSIVVTTPVITQIGSNAGNTWSVTMVADTTNGRPAIKVTGEADKTIYWGATVKATRISN